MGFWVLGLINFQFNFIHFCIHFFNVSEEYLILLNILLLFWGFGVYFLGFFSKILEGYLQHLDELRRERLCWK